MVYMVYTLCSCVTAFENLSIVYVTPLFFSHFKCMHKCQTRYSYQSHTRIPDTVMILILPLTAIIITHTVHSKKTTNSLALK